jgi:hypothetical protein
MPICWGFRASGLLYCVARLFFSDTSTGCTIITFKGLRVLEEFIIHEHTTRKVTHYTCVSFTMIYALQLSWDVLADANFLWDKDDNYGMFRGMRKPDRLRTYNITLRHVHSTTVAVEKQEVLHFLSVYL